MILDGGVPLSEFVDLVEGIPFEVVGFEIVSKVFYKAGPGSKVDRTIIFVDIFEKHCFPGVSVSSFYVGESKHNFFFVISYLVQDEV